nr:MAG TPA: hypothetical protein [Caudoviricetes sp.]
MVIYNRTQPEQILFSVITHNSKTEQKPKAWHQK